MNINAAAIRRGGAIIKWRGATFYHRGELQIPMQREDVNIDVEPFGIVDRGHNRVNLPINFRPSGRLSEIEAIVNRYASSVPGQLINIEEYPVSINAGTDVLTTTGNHLLNTGDEVMVHSLITMPAGLSRTTRYYARVASATTLTLFDTYAHAIDGVEVAGLIDITSAGSGVILDIARPLIVHTFDGLHIKYHAAGLVNLGALNLTAGDTLLDQVGFMAFVRPGQDPEDMTGAFHEITYVPFSDTSFDPADLPRLSPVVTWGNGSPWSDGLSTRGGAKANFELTLNNLPNDAFGEDQIGRIFSRIDVTVTAAVQGVTEAEAKAALKIQSAKRGESIGGDGALTITAGDVEFELADAALMDAPQNFGSQNQREGDFVWRANPTFTASVKNPLFELTV